MIRKQILKVMLFLFLCLGITQKISANKEGTNEANKTISLSEFLNEIGEKHKVFFTYSPVLLTGSKLNPSEYQYAKLDLILNKLEKKTSFGFEYLGNNYYVVYHKKEARLKLNKVPAINKVDFVMPKASIEKQREIKGTIVDEELFLI